MVVMNMNLKHWFLIGLLSISMHLGDFGGYVLRSECMWACSCFGIDPPAELVRNLDAKGLDKTPLDNAPPTGFHSDDPVDLANSVICLTTELIEVKKMQENFERREEERRAVVAEAIRQAPLSTILGQDVFDGKGDIKTSQPSFAWYIWKSGKRVPLD